MSDEAMNNFTPRAQQVLALARKKAGRLNHNFIGTEHVLLGLIELRQGVGFNVLMRLNLQPDEICLEVEKLVGTGPDQAVIGTIPYTPRVKKVLMLASKEAKLLSHSYVGTEHILLGLLREGDGVAFRVLSGFGLNLELVRQEVLKELDPTYKPETTTERKVVNPTDDVVMKRCIDILSFKTDGMSIDVEALMDRVKLIVLSELGTAGYFQAVGMGAIDLVDRVVCGSGSREVLKACALIYEQILPATAHGHVASVSHVQDRFGATTADSLEERRFGTVLQILTGKPVSRTVTMDFLSPVPVVTPSGGLV